jgi:DNA invertase Pin-like site-specific DNA recombinase
MRAALYARVSTTDKGQDTENQLAQLRQYCARQGWEVVEKFVDHATGKTAARDAFKRLFLAAAQRAFDVVVVWALDRLTREGVLETFEHVRRLNQYGIQFESFTEPHFRTTGAAGELMLAVAAWIAKQERIRISDRTRAGLDRARLQRKKLGRPPRVFRRDELIRLRDVDRLSWREIAKQLGVPVSTAVDAYGSVGDGLRMPAAGSSSNTQRLSPVAASVSC